ncbi:zinc-binding dehydrogenase [Streptomyces sp. NPDC088816]|uniref:zinc-binding dehydrogenase n=1 Tax=Streptomyces sp. NPDC088816 TaxID=3365906 RepID=UPI00381F6AD8
MQAAQARGAGLVVAAARSEASQRRALADGAEHAVPTGDDLAGRLHRVAPAGFDVIIDFLWGDAAAAALTTAASGARLVQVGNQAGPTATIDAGWRNRGVRMIGHSNFLSSLQERRAAYAELMRLASEGRLHVDIESRPLEEAEQVWMRLAGGSGARLVLRPQQ